MEGEPIRESGQRGRSFEDVGNGAQVRAGKGGIGGGEHGIHQGDIGEGPEVRIRTGKKKHKTALTISAAMIILMFATCEKDGAQANYQNQGPVTQKQDSLASMREALMIEISRAESIILKKKPDMVKASDPVHQ